jgi:hypothetical protein
MRFSNLATRLGFVVINEKIDRIRKARTSDGRNLAFTIVVHIVEPEERTIRLDNFSACLRGCFVGTKNIVSGALRGLTGRAQVAKYLSKGHHFLPCGRYARQE